MSSTKTISDEKKQPLVPNGFDVKPISEVLSQLGVTEEKGLSKSDIEGRRAKVGFNEIEEKKAHPLVLFLSKFWGLSAWMLELIMVLSGILGKYPDLIIIGILLVLNAILGYTQEARAAGVVAALRKRLQVNARILRDSVWGVIPARELVPGDLIRIRSGDVVPADAKLLGGTLTIDESVLTGESKDSEKAVGSIVSSGSIVRTGEGNCVVVLTGKDTLFGRTTQLVQDAKPKLHIEVVIGQVVKWLFSIVAVMLAVVVIQSIVRGESLVVMVPLILVLLMSSVPVALPVMFTVALSTGSKELAKLGVLVTRLSATEDAATMDVLCVDKTGTLTLNELAIVGTIPYNDSINLDIMVCGVLASNESNQDPIDLAFLKFAKDKKIFERTSPAKAISFLPFDAKNRRTEAVIEQDGKRFQVMKGAVRTIAETCKLPESVIATLEKSAEDAGKKGYRTLGVARGLEEGEMKFLGLVTLNDPLRPDAKSLIAALQGYGVAVKMLTGDAIAVALEIAKDVGLPNIHKAEDLKKLVLKATDIIHGIDGFAEVYPEDKFTVVQKLQAAGHVTGMTGDGVNDAPALRQAEVGIAVSSATDVAKGAASVVLTDPGLTNILSLVQQGRTIYQRILTWIINKISRTVMTATYVAVAYMVTGRFVVTTFAMLLLVFMTDFAKIALATDNVRPSKKPETWKIGGYISVALVHGILMILEALGLLWFYWNRLNLATNSGVLSSFSFLTLLYFSAFSIISSRERRWFFATRPSWTLLGAIIGEVIVGTLLTFIGVPGLSALPATVMVYTLLFTFSSFLLNDAVKVSMIKTLVPS